MNEDYIATKVDFYKKYSDDYETLFNNEIEPSCEIVDSDNNAAGLQRKVKNVREALQNIQQSLQTDWQDSVEGQFSSYINSCDTYLGQIETSIEGDFTSAETCYTELKNLLNDLSSQNTAYQTRWDEKPNLSDSKYTVSHAEERDSSGTIIKNAYTEQDEGKYNIDLDNWKEDVKSKASVCIETIANVETKITELTEINTNVLNIDTTDTGFVGSAPQFEFDAISILNCLPETQRDYILNVLGWTGNNPYNERYTQSNVPGINFAGGPLNRTGCAGVAFNYAIACALTSQYGTSVDISRKDFFNKLYSDNNSSSSTYGTNGYSWTSSLPKHLTNSFRDLSILQLQSNWNGVLNHNQIEQITDAGGIIVESIKDESHFGVITGVDKNTGKVKFMDPGFQGNEEIDMNQKNQLNYHGRRDGDISGKAVWVVFPNKNCSNSGNDEISINGLNVNNIPGVEAFYTGGVQYGVSKNSDGSMKVEGFSKNNRQSVSI